jgi:hypothetical protein
MSRHRPRPIAGPIVIFVSDLEIRVQVLTSEAYNNGGDAAGEREMLTGTTTVTTASRNGLEVL